VAVGIEPALLPQATNEAVTPINTNKESQRDILPMIDSHTKKER